MKFASTRGSSPLVSAREVVLSGVANDGGLFVPVEVPKLSPVFWDHVAELSFAEIALKMAEPYFSPEVSSAELERIVTDAMTFSTPMVAWNENTYVLELFHGPTLAFKDVGARFLARLTKYFVQDEGVPTTVLVATSGDTGSAVAHGFFGVPGVNVVVLYPSGQVSAIQEKQMTTLGDNIHAVELKGNFDDCQSLVKQAFRDKDLKQRRRFMSANSINFGRLVPQMFYYAHALGQVRQTLPNLPVVFSVPSGNFGNLLSGLMAERMGMRECRWVAATNANDVVPSALRSGQFRPRPSVRTISNAMDVGHPSNFERILHLFGSDYPRLRDHLFSMAFDDSKTREAIRQVYEKTGYVVDPHGAVGYLGLQAWRSHSSNVRHAAVVLETAHPSKFAAVVEPIIGRPVPIPEQLTVVLEGKKQATKLLNDFAGFKNFLMDLE